MRSRWILVACALVALLPLSVTAQPVDIILHNGTVLTMNPAQPRARALAISGNQIIAVGGQGTVNRLGGRGTRRINLKGKTVLPGFVDPHNHALGTYVPGSSFDELDELQQFALEGGVTSLGDPAMLPFRMFDLMEAIKTTDLRVRVGVYLMYNTKCNGVVLPGSNWIESFPPDRDPHHMLRVLGIKIFGDSGQPLPPYCGWAATDAELPQWVQDETGAGPHGELAISVEEMTEVISKYQELGYQTVFHARGDRVIDAALDAIELALNGQPNTYRHRIDHNDLVRPDQLTRFGLLGVSPVVRVKPNYLGAPTCYVESLGGVHPFGEVAHPWSRVVRSLIEVNPGLPVAWHSDNFYPATNRHPMSDLWELITRKEVDYFDESHVCEPTLWLTRDAPTVEQALRMMTINAAYTLFLEESVGSLQPGKFADVIVLSDNPLTVDPDSLRDIDVLMTMVGGKVEHCLPGHDLKCN